MFVSVKERARQIASGQFTASTSSVPVVPPVDRVPEPIPVIAAATKKTGTTAISPSRSKPKSSKAIPSKESIAQPASAKPDPPQQVRSKGVLSRSAVPPEKSVPKKSSVKPKTHGDFITKPSSSKLGSPETASKSRATSEAKTLSTPKVGSLPTATLSAKSKASKGTNKRSKTPPKRVDSPIEDNEDPLSSLKTTCLKQISGVTGLGGRRLAIVLKQRSSGEWYAALKDTGSDKYLKMWMNRDKTYATKEEALEAYLVFVTKMRNEVRWFPMSPRANSPKGKGR